MNDGMKPWAPRDAVILMAPTEFGDPFLAMVVELVKCELLANKLHAQRANVRSKYFVRIRRQDQEAVKEVVTRV